MIDVKDHTKYPDHYFIGCYKMQESLMDEILKWKEDNKHLGSKTIIQNKSSNDVSKACLEWSIDYDNIYHPWQNYQKSLNLCIGKYFENFYSSKLMRVRMELEDYNLQHYRPGEGFYLWHKENTGDEKTVRRHLVFMTYLTNTPNAGTEFETQKLTVPCEKGVTLIWPAGWTHTHRGQVSLTHEKIIITGWIRLQK